MPPLRAWRGSTHGCQGRGRSRRRTHGRGCWVRAFAAPLRYPRGGPPGASAPFRKPRGKQRDRLLVDLGLIPGLEHGEVLRAFGKGLSTLPAIALEIVRGRSEHVWHAVDQVAAAVAVEIDRILHIGGRQELGLAELARPGAAQTGDREVPAI